MCSRKGKARAMIEDLHFHDLRHEAITRFATRLDVLELCWQKQHHAPSFAIFL